MTRSTGSNERKQYKYEYRGPTKKRKLTSSGPLPRGKKQQFEQLPEIATKPKWPDKAPKSCIESAETLLRFAYDPNYKFAGGGKAPEGEQRHMYLHLRNGVCTCKIDLSDAKEKVIFGESAGRTSYVDDDYKLCNLKYGQGIGLIRVSAADPKDDKGYDMHFMVLLDKEQKSGECEFSDVSQPTHWNGSSMITLSLEKETIKKAKTVRQLRGNDYASTTDYACGILTLSTDPPSVVLKTPPDK